MKPLLAADVVVEDEKQKGVYIIQPHKVQGIIMLVGRYQRYGGRDLYAESMGKSR